MRGGYVRVKIKYCSDNTENVWYSRYIGAIYYVENSKSWDDYWIVTRGFRRGRYILKSDCISLIEDTYPSSLIQKNWCEDYLEDSIQSIKNNNLREELIKSITANLPRDILFNKDTPRRVINQADAIIKEMKR